MDDKSNLPYTEAVTQELLRMTCIAPMALPHWISGDIEVNGMRLTKGTMVFPNLHRITRNPQAFPNPNEFLPERFLDSNGRYVKNELNIPFGIGRYHRIDDLDRKDQDRDRRSLFDLILDHFLL